MKGKRTSCSSRKGKEKVHEEKGKNVKNNSKVRRLTLIYTDPYATEDSSDEAEENSVRNVPKRFVKEILVPKKWPTEASSSRAQTRDITIDMIKPCPIKMRKGSTSIYRGVQRRKWGKYIAEIHDPIQGKRIWLGTFDSEEEAAITYEKKKLEFEDAVRKKRDRELTMEFRKRERAALLSHPSTSSVLHHHHVAAAASASRASPSTSGGSTSKAPIDNVSKVIGGNSYAEDEDDSIQHLLEEPTMPMMMFDDDDGIDDGLYDNNDINDYYYYDEGMDGFYDNNDINNYYYDGMDGFYDMNDINYYDDYYPMMDVENNNGGDDVEGGSTTPSSGSDVDESELAAWVDGDDDDTMDWP